MDIFCVCECNFLKIYVFSQRKIEFWGFSFGNLEWSFLDFLGKWWFFLCESALKNKICALQTGTVPFRIRKAFVYLNYILHYI